MWAFVEKEPNFIFFRSKKKKKKHQGKVPFSSSELNKKIFGVSPRQTSLNNNVTQTYLGCGSKQTSTLE